MAAVAAPTPRATPRTLTLTLTLTLVLPAAAVAAPTARTCARPTRCPPASARWQRCAASPGMYTHIVMRLQPLACMATCTCHMRMHMTCACMATCTCACVHVHVHVHAHMSHVWLHAHVHVHVWLHVWLQARGVWRHMVHAVAASATHDCSLFCILCAHACGCSLCYIRLLRVLQVQMNHHAEAASATKGCSYRGGGGYSVCCRPMTNSYRPGAYHAGWQLAELT